MNFTLTDEQAMIRESAARLVTERQRRAPGTSGFDRDLWQAIVEMGWIAAGIAEQDGGFGGPIEAVLVAEELGRGGIGGDFLGAGILGPQLLAATGPSPIRDQMLADVVAGATIVAAAFSEPDARGELAFVRTVAASSGERYRLSGLKTLVLAGDVADRLIVSARTSGADGDIAGIALFLVDPRSSGVTIIPTPLVDGSSAATIRLESADGELIGRSGYAALQAMAEIGIAWIAAESVGMMEAIGEMTAEYLGNRSQFGVPLSQFQVLQHKLADMVIDAEMTRATLLVALASFELRDPILRRRRFSGVKAAAGAALRRVAGAGVQAHGGMGMTIEYPVGHFLQRSVALDAVLGLPSHHRAVCAAALAA